MSGKGGHFAPQGESERGNNSRGEEEESPPAPSSRGPPNGNGGRQEGADPDAALVDLFEKVRRRALTAKEAVSFREAVAEAREAGATDGLIAGKIRGADRTAAAWDPPNLAREVARKILASYQAAVRFPPGQQRASLGHILRDLDFARRSLAKTPRPEPGDEGLALWQAQVAWAEAHAADLNGATSWAAEPVAVEAGAAP